MSLSQSDDEPSESNEEKSDRTANESLEYSITARPRDHAYLPTSHPLYIPLFRDKFDSDLNDLSSARASNIQELPVLELTGVQLFPGSIFPLRFSQSDSSWVEYLGRQIKLSRQSPGQASEVRLGVLTAKPPPELERAVSLDRRRQSWTRQAFGPDRLRRLSLQLIRELGNLDELSETEDEGDEQEERDGSVNVRAQQMETDDETSPVPSSSLHSNMDALRQKKDRCGYIGRIGTIVTVMNTHGDEVDNGMNSSSSSIWQSLNENDQLVLTTLATSRFRILGYSNPEDEATMYQRLVLQRSFPWSFSTTVPTFIVEVMDETTLVIPTFQRPISTGHRNIQENTWNDKIISSFAMITPFPEFVCSKIWPHRLVTLIREEMTSSNTFRVFLESLPTCREQKASFSSTNSSAIPTMTLLDEAEEEDPIKMSFWLASNLPFSESEKFQLLEMHSAAERLQYIYHKVKARTEPFICCQSCGVPLARASYMFTVGGAEGTTGAYVNEHGFVHQTLTVRRLLSLDQNLRSGPTETSSSDDEREAVFFSGGPQTKDSWFPGYSWTIMCCSLCHSHLGWKFLRVKRYKEEKVSNDRPNLFYGLSGASVNIAIPQ